MRATLGILGVVLFSTPSWAGPKTVSIGPCRWQAIPKPARDKFLARVRESLGKAGYQVAADRAALHLDCNVEALGSTYLFTLTATCPAAAAPITRKGTCEVCRLQEAASSLATTILDLLQRADRACTPRPARPAAPAARPAQVKPPRPRTRPTPRPVPAQALRPEPRDTKRRDTKALWMKVSGGILGGVAVGLLTAGAVFVAIHGKGTCDQPGECPEVYDTKNLGIGLLVGGGIAAAGAATLVTLGFLLRPDRPAERQARWLLGPGSIAWSLSF